jgi:uncharacterized membrane protein
MMTMFQSQFVSGMVHWIHLIAAVTWLGGTIYAIVVLRPSLKDVDPAVAVKLSLVSDMRFRVVSIAALIALLLTGLFLVSSIFEGVGSPSAFFGSPYGRILGVKIVLAVIAIASGLTAGFWLAPKLVYALEARDESAAERIRRYMAVLCWIGFTLGILITVCAAFLRVNA